MEGDLDADGPAAPRPRPPGQRHQREQVEARAVLPAQRPPGHVQLDAAAPEGEAAFQRLVEAVRRCVGAGRFEPVDPMGLLGWSVQLWTMRHGLVSLAIAGLLPLENVPLHFADMSARLFVGYGDSREAARRSVEQGMR
ncbi:TetR-like C-terminal domain-containing protein [Nonomuraea dietziae]|uniref:TetR-like C-terminal domain-containing protein n=1 Tax=Nonomuraea dietziae TaxID=65515 RepID=UPI00342C0D38